MAEEVNQQFEDDSYGSRSSIDEIARVNDDSNEVEMEGAICIYKEIIRPMLREDINEDQQKFLLLMVKKYGLNILKGMTWNLDHTASTSGSQALQLQFSNGISTPVSTGMDIKGEDNKPLMVALVDGTGEIVKTGVEAAAEVEIVVLEGDFSNDEAKKSSDKFNSKIVRDWKGTKVLQGNTFLKLKEVYKKHPTPSSSDELWRLNMISRRSDCFDRLTKANIKTVMDFRTLQAINPKSLKDILDVTPRKWKVITDHAQKCKDDKGIYLYHHARDGQKSNSIIFNIFGQLVGLIAESQFIPSDKLPSDKKADAQELVVSSSEHWKEVIPFTDQASLMNHLQLATTTTTTTTTLNSLRLGLSVVIPQTTDTHDPATLTSPLVIKPICPTNSPEYDDLSFESQSQSPKRSASEPAVSNSPKKPRDDHPRMSPSTPSVGTSRIIYTNVTEALQEPDNLENDPELFEEEEEEEDFMQYLNLVDRWKMVWYAVGWISVISKIRKRRMSCCQVLETSDCLVDAE